MPDGADLLRRLSLGELIGAPLSAVVEAERHAAESTAAFIREVGFSSAQPSAHLGSLRMVEFSYRKLDADGDVATYRASVPALSLFPIPALRIKTGKIAFTAKVYDAAPVVSPRDSAQTGLERPRYKLIAGLSPKDRIPTEPSGPAGARGSYEIDIEIEVETAPITTGIEKLLVTFDQALTDQKLEERAMRMASGSTPPGATNWQAYPEGSGIFVDVDTSEHGFVTTPRYFTSLGGGQDHWVALGATSIYMPSPGGFRVYVRWDPASIPDKVITVEEANEKGLYINWFGIESG